MVAPEFPPTGHVGASSTAIAVEGPEFFFNGVPGGTIERDQVGVPEGLLTIEGRVQIGSPKIAGRPWRAIKMAEDKASGLGGPDASAMDPLPDAETRQSAVGNEERGTLSAFRLGLRTQAKRHEAAARRQVEPGTVSRFQDRAIDPF
jgi:hypothetical protein